MVNPLVQKKPHPQYPRKFEKAVQFVWADWKKLYFGTFRFASELDPLTTNQSSY